MPQYVCACLYVNVAATVFLRARVTRRARARVGSTYPRHLLRAEDGAGPDDSDVADDLRPRRRRSIARPLPHDDGAQTHRDTEALLISNSGEPQRPLVALQRGDVAAPVASRCVAAPPRGP